MQKGHDLTDSRVDKLISRPVGLHVTYPTQELVGKSTTPK